MTATETTMPTRRPSHVAAYVVEVTRVAEVVGGVRAEGIVRDPDGCTALDRMVAYTLPHRGHGSLSVAWMDGTVSDVSSAFRRRAARVLRAAIDKHMGWC